MTEETTPVVTEAEKVDKVDSAFRTLLSEVKDSRIVQAITDFIISGEDKTKAALHDILATASEDTDEVEKAVDDSE